MGRLTKAQIQQKLNAANKQNKEQESWMNGFAISTLVLSLILFTIWLIDDEAPVDCLGEISIATEKLETEKSDLQRDLNRADYSFTMMSSSNRQLRYFIDTLADKSRPYHEEAMTKMTHYVNQKNTFAYGDATERRELMEDIKKDFDCNDDDGYGCPVVDALLSCDTSGEEDSDEARAECFINNVLEDKTYSNSY